MQMGSKMSSIDRSLLRSYPELKDLLLSDSNETIKAEIADEQAKAKPGFTSMDPPRSRPKAKPKHR